MTDDSLIKGENYYQFNGFLKSGVIAAFSNRRLDLGFRVGTPQEIRNNRKAFLDSLSINCEELVCCQQPHGRNASVVSRHDTGRGVSDFETAVADSDALITNCRNLALAVFCADCLPIFLYAPGNNAVGIIHAGWQGTKEGVTKNTVELMRKNFNINVQDLLIGFGPAIRNCCYEVMDEFRDYFPSGIQERSGRLYLDLIAVNIAQLKSLGVKESQIVDTGLCTSCMNKEFFSYRREGSRAGRMMSVIMLRGKSALIKKYLVEFVLNSRLASPDMVKNSLLEFGDNLNVIENTGLEPKALKISIETQDPTIVFDVCSQFGRLGFVKIEEKE